MNLSGRQIRAARSLAGWDRPDLAERVGLSLMTIQNIELESKQPKQKTLDKIIAAFADIGIEFTDNEGVRRRPANIRTFEGSKGFSDFYDLVYECLKENGGAVCICGSSAKIFKQHRHNPELHRQRMASLVSSRDDVSVRIIAAEGDLYMPNTAYAQYRWQPREFFPPTTFYAFGEYLGIISFAHNPPPLVVLIQSQPIAESYRASFDFAWQNAKIPDHGEGP